MIVALIASAWPLAVPTVTARVATQIVKSCLFLDVLNSRPQLKSEHPSSQNDSHCHSEEYKQTHMKVSPLLFSEVLDSPPF